MINNLEEELIKKLTNLTKLKCNLSMIHLYISNNQSDLKVKFILNLDAYVNES